jgi:CRISPR system Cascade subunit CasD
MDALLRYQREDGNTKGTLLSTREYRTEATYWVALHADNEVLQNIQQALQEPKFHLYLGRKTCVLNLPLFSSLETANGFEEALTRGKARFNEKFSQLGVPPINSEMAEYYWEESCPTQQVATNKISVRTVPVSRANWQFKEQPLLHVIKKEVAV